MSCRPMLIIFPFIYSDVILYIVFVLIYFSDTNLYELL